MRSSAWLVVSLLAAGCLGASGPAPATSGTAPPSLVAPVNPSGATAHRLVDAFAMQHPNRNNDNPAAKADALAYLESNVQSYGLRTERQPYSATGTNLLAMIEGTRLRNESIVLSCHYDGVWNGALRTVYGARDDGLGCAAVLEMARAFAARSWNHTLVFAFFDEEELGLLGAKAYVKRSAEEGNGSVAADLNFDPAGLHFPCGDAAAKFPVYLIITESKLAGPAEVPGYAQLLDASRAAFLAHGTPASLIRVSTTHAYARVNDQRYQQPGSDDDAFDAADIPSIWFGAPPADEVGPVGIWGYPNHTAADTLTVVEERCGSAALLEQGLQLAMDAALDTLAVIDAA